jgi:proteasome lid subunit RPN8/RPN11
MSTSRQSQRLPQRPLNGDYAITDAALDAAERLLPTYRGPDGPHEGIAFLAGVETPSTTFLLATITPEADHGRGHVFCSAAEVLAASRAARANGLAILAQLHTHPSPVTFHSVGDDSMVLLPFEGMLSIVAPEYGRYGLRPLDSLGIHQFQGGRWVLCERSSTRAGFRIVTSSLDLR